MAKIPGTSIKRIIRQYAKVNITDEGAAALAKILEDKARAISKFAVKNAKKSGRTKITKEDVLKYTLNSD